MPPPIEIAVIGTSHGTTGFAIREQVAAGLTPRAVARTLAPIVDEAVSLVTCDRCEVILATRRPASVRQARDALAELAGVPPEELHVRRGRGAIRHVMRVTMGLDALVPGEHEIQGQAGHAWRSARSHGSAGPVMAALFQRALHTAGRARAETGLGRGRVSIASLAFEHVTPHLGESADADIVVVGSDPVARGLARRLAASNGGTLWTAGPGGEAARFAREVGGEPLPPGRTDEVVADCRLAILAARPHPPVERALRRAPRHGTTRLVMDLCMPRALPPGTSPPGQSVATLEDLRPRAEQAVVLRSRDAAAAERIASEGTAWIVDWLAGRQAASAIRALTDHVEALRRREVSRFVSGADDPDVARRLEHLSRRLTGVLLHAPVTRLRHADDPDADAEVLLRLLGPTSHPNDAGGDDGSR